VERKDNRCFFERVNKGHSTATHLIISQTDTKFNTSTTNQTIAATQSLTYLLT